MVAKPTRLAEMGMAPPLATEVINQVGAGAIDRISAFSAPRIGTLGDSRTADEFNMSASFGYKNVGYMTWLRQITRQRFVHTQADIFATSGFNTQQIIDTWLTPAAQSSCAGMIVLAGTNDRVQGLTLAQTTTNLDKILTTLTNAGKWVILVAETPRGNAAFNPTQRLTGTPLQNHMAVRRWCQQQASRPNVYVVDPWPLMLADVTSTDATAGADIAANMTRDGLHYGGQGAYTLASLMQPIVEQKLPRAEILPVSNFDLYSVDNPGGSITPNPMMSGSGGPLVQSSGTLTGPVPVGYRAETINCAGVTVTLSTPTINGQIWWQAVISGTPTQASPKVQLRHGAQSTAQVGDTLELVAEYQVDAGQTGLNAVQAFWNDFSGSFYYSDGSATNAAFNFPSNAVSGVLRSPQAQVVTAGNTSDEFGITLLQNVAVNATVRMRALSYRKVV
jgi:lysophospholipase L1-like esterase